MNTLHIMFKSFSLNCRSGVADYAVTMRITYRPDHPNDYPINLGHYLVNVAKQDAVKQKSPVLDIEDILHKRMMTERLRIYGRCRANWLEFRLVIKKTTHEGPLGLNQKRGYGIYDWVT